jgi:hypothetical protein
VLFLVGIFLRGTEHDHQAVAEELIQSALIPEHHLNHLSKVLVEEVHYQ